MHIAAPNVAHYRLESFDTSELVRLGLLDGHRACIVLAITHAIEFLQITAIRYLQQGVFSYRSIGPNKRVLDIVLRL